MKGCLKIFFKKRVSGDFVFIYTLQTMAGLPESARSAALPPTATADVALAGLKRHRDTEAEVDVFEAAQTETITFQEVQTLTNALSFEARRIDTFHSHVESMSILALNDFAFFDTRQEFTDILGPLRTLGQRAGIECEERAVIVDGVLEQLQHAARRLEGVHDMQCLEGMDVCTIQTTLLRSARQLPLQLLLIGEEALSKLQTLAAITSALTAANLAELQNKFAEAVSTTNTLALSLLIADGRVDLADCCTLEVLVAAVKDKHTDILRTVVKLSRNHVAFTAELMLIEPPAARQAAFEACVLSAERRFSRKAKASCVFALLKAGSVSPGTCSDALLLYSVYLQDVDTLHALFANPSSNFSTTGILAAIDTAYIRRASALHGQSLVELLHALIDYACTWRTWHAAPAVHLSTIFRLALEYDDVAALKMLLADPRVDPRTCVKRDYVTHILNPFTASLESDTNTDTDILALLLKDGRADPAQHRDATLREAVLHGHAERVKLLLADPRVDVLDTRPAGMTPFEYAVAKSRVDVIAVFLKSNRDNITVAEIYAALAHVRQLGQSQILKLLLADERFRRVDAGSSVDTSSSVTVHPRRQ